MKRSLCAGKLPVGDRSGKRHEVRTMKKILITSVSGPLGTGVINAIRAMDEPGTSLGLIQTRSIF